MNDALPSNPKVSVVMPGHVGTSIVANSMKVLGGAEPLEMSDADVKAMRERMMNLGDEAAELIMNLSDDQIRALIHERGVAFEQGAPTSAEAAANIILEAVKAGKWRILVGGDAERLDARVRANPEMAYEPEFAQALVDDGDLGGLIRS